jgi:hypothetical protein
MKGIDGHFVKSPAGEGQLLQLLAELYFRGSADHLINHLTIAKEEKGGHTPDLVMAGRSRMLGGVQGRDMDPAQVFPIKPVNDRGQGLAGTAGRGVKVNHHRQDGPAKKILEFMIRQFNGLGRFSKIKSDPAFTALGMQMLFVGGNSVFTGAGWAGGDKGIHGSIPQTRGQKGRYNAGIHSGIQDTLKAPPSQNRNDKRAATKVLV